MAVGTNSGRRQRIGLCHGWNGGVILNHHGCNITEHVTSLYLLWLKIGQTEVWEFFNIAGGYWRNFAKRQISLNLSKSFGKIWEQLFLEQK